MEMEISVVAFLLAGAAITFETQRNRVSGGVDFLKESRLFEIRITQGRSLWLITACILSRSSFALMGVNSMRIFTQLHIIVAMLTLFSLTSGQSPQQAVMEPVDPHIPAIIQAVEDEIYDQKYEGNYFLIDDQGAGDSKPAKISIYISKEISKDGDGVAIYKLMPYGEVYRLFVVQKNGLVLLLGDPHNRFPPIGGSMLTVYMTDDKVCDFIRNKATKAYFTVDPEVSKQRLNEAIQRELKRDGFSYRRYAKKHAKKK